MLKNWVFEHGARRDIGAFGHHTCLLCLTRRWRSHRARVTGWQIRRLPIHRHPDPGASAWVIEENEFFHRTGIELAISAQLERHLSESIGFARSVDAEGIGLPFRHSHRRVAQRGDEKKEGRKNQDE